jgi:hypothetical protein
MPTRNPKARLKKRSVEEGARNTGKLEFITQTF